MFEGSTFKSLKYYASNFFFWGGEGRTRSVVRLTDVKGKNIIGPLPTKPAEVRSENRTNTKEAKHLLKANS